MVFAETSVIDSINVDEHGIISVRRADIVLRDDIEIARTYHRHVLAPGDDLADQDIRVAAVASTVWTPDVLDAWAARVAAIADALVQKDAP